MFHSILKGPAELPTAVKHLWTVHKLQVNTVSFHLHPSSGEDYPAMKGYRSSSSGGGIRDGGGGGGSRGGV